MVKTFMLIDFKQQQLAQFEQLIEKLTSDPKRYLDFQHVADFYQAEWLTELPSAARYAVSGLDDGAENFEVSIVLYTHVFRLSFGDKISMRYTIRGISCVF